MNNLGYMCFGMYICKYNSLKLKYEPGSISSAYTVFKTMCCLWGISAYFLTKKDRVRAIREENESNIECTSVLYPGLECALSSALRSSFHHKYPVGLVFRYFLKTLTHTHGALITPGWAPFSLQKGVMSFLTLSLLLLSREAYSDTSCFLSSALAWVPYSHRHALSNSLCSLNPFQIHFIQNFSV